MYCTYRTAVNDDALNILGGLLGFVFPLWPIISISLLPCLAPHVAAVGVAALLRRGSDGIDDLPLPCDGNTGCSARGSVGS